MAAGVWGVRGDIHLPSPTALESHFFRLLISHAIPRQNILPDSLKRPGASAARLMQRGAKILSHFTFNWLLLLLLPIQCFAMPRPPGAMSVRVKVRCSLSVAGMWRRHRGLSTVWRI